MSGSYASKMSVNGICIGQWTMAHKTCQITPSLWESRNRQRLSWPRNEPNATDFVRVKILKVKTHIIRSVCPRLKIPYMEHYVINCVAAFKVIVFDFLH